MVKFNLSQCTLMICVSDEGCMRRCEDALFPCVDFQYLHFHPGEKLPSALEQIGVLKLFHIPQALKRKVRTSCLPLLHPTHSC